MAWSSFFFLQVTENYTRNKEKKKTKQNRRLIMTASYFCLIFFFYSLLLLLIKKWRSDILQHSLQKMRHSSKGILIRSYGESPLNDKIKVKRGKKSKTKQKIIYLLCSFFLHFFFNEDNFQTKQFLKSGLSKSYPLSNYITPCLRFHSHMFGSITLQFC